MAQELKFIRGDSYDILVNINDSYGADVDITGGGWIVAFSSDVIEKNSADNPDYFIIEQAPYTKGQVVIGISSDETLAVDQCRHTGYKIKLYKTTHPQQVKTVASGDLFFVDEV